MAIHGDNTVASRNELFNLISLAKTKGVRDVIRLEGKKLDLTVLIQATSSQSLFGTDRLVIIEDLFSRPQSQTKKQLLGYLKTIHSNTFSPDIFIWDKKLLTPTELKSIGNPQNHPYKLSKYLFAFLDSLKPGNSRTSLQLLHQTLDSEAPELIVFLLARQLHLLIQVKSQARLRLAPWQINKLKSQAASFSLNQLLKFHHTLLTLDTRAKTGQNLLELSSELDILIVNL